MGVAGSMVLQATYLPADLYVSIMAALASAGVNIYDV